jgi:hypothetical protein
MRYFDDEPDDDEDDEDGSSDDASDGAVGDADGELTDEVDAELDADLEEDFALGDGSADTESTVHCPYCGEAVEIALDPGGGATQAYVEDCQVCCQPWRVHVQYGADGGADVWVAALDE